MERVRMTCVSRSTPETSRLLYIFVHGRKTQGTFIFSNFRLVHPVWEVRALLPGKAWTRVCEEPSPTLTDISHGNTELMASFLELSFHTNYPRAYLRQTTVCIEDVV